MDETFSLEKNRFLPLEASILTSSKGDVCTSYSTRSLWLSSVFVDCHYGAWLLISPRCAVPEIVNRMRVGDGALYKLSLSLGLMPAQTLVSARVKSAMLA